MFCFVCKPQKLFFHLVQFFGPAYHNKLKIWNYLIEIEWKLSGKQRWESILIQIDSLFKEGSKENYNDISKLMI
ncbi:MAG: hypothetical protein OMM_11622 [Candidatus Magnetoglobus multicellularis str. Araruama]|uniref:Uncharacterized protein n=1 Tax=Candidatus Magnetoglobus multicellularis str. Araruama TaxID=890399 RepID=A0A1V1NXU9_9BACT|nr:MAG: hypothetical protein OMM_11622 [Candidatus Magnetoglobus multicellularis str. Araruama]